MKDNKLKKNIIVLALLILISPILYGAYYKKTLKDRFIDEINHDFNITIFYPNSLLLYAKSGNQECAVLDYSTLNMEGVRRLLLETDILRDADYSYYLEKFEADPNFDLIKQWVDFLDSNGDKELRGVANEKKEFFMLYDRTSMNAILFHLSLPK